MGTPGSDCESVNDLSEMKFRDVSYVQGKSRICTVIHEKINATGELVSMYPPHVQVVGLYGQGGMGKTTFCRAMCNEMWTKFNGKVFHFELGGENELQTLQTLLGKLAGTRNEDNQKLDMYECGRKLRKEVSKHRVFLAIDNVTDSAEVIAQADALLANWYPRGSVVLVTARSYDQLEKLKFPIRESHCIEMPELEENEAMSLLLYHAAPSNHVNEDVLRQCLQRCYVRNLGDDDDDDCHFLPLASEMLGEQLGSDADQWMAKLEELDTSNPRQGEEHPIFSILKKSFDTLSIEDQILFMDAALFYPRNYYHPLNRSRAWNILDWLHMIHGGSVEDIKRRLKGLKEKSLLQSFDESRADIGIHDVWREFAAMEANLAGNQESSLWFYDNDKDAGTCRHRGESSLRGGGWENLRRAFIWRGRAVKDDSLNFSLCSNLTVLTLRNVPSVNKKLDLSPLKRLKYLEVDLPVREVLGLGSLGHLAVLRWFRMLATSPCLQEIGLLTNLQVLQLQFLPWKCKDISRLNFDQMDFSRLSLLRIVSLYAATGDGGMRLPLRYSRNVQSLKREIERVVCGAYRGFYGRVDGDGVYMIQGLQNFQKLQSLQKLDISGCQCIKALPGLDEVVALLELNVSGCTGLEELPNLQKLQRLQRLDLSYCLSVRALPGLDELVALLELDACGCCNLGEIPSLQKLQNLERLDISVCSTIKSVAGLDELVALLALRAGGCSSLEALPNLQKLQKLQRLDISWCPLIKALPGLGDLVALQELRAGNCFSLAELPDLRRLTSLRVLSLKISSYYEGYQMGHPEEAYFEKVVPALVEAVPGIDELVALAKLSVGFAVFEDVSPGESLRKLTNLTKLSLRGWSSRAAFGVASLPNLQVLKISYGEGLQLFEPTGVSSLTSLRRLQFYCCDFEDVSGLSSLPAFQNFHIRCHNPNPKKLLLSLLELPILRCTVDVDVADYRIWNSTRYLVDIRDEVDRLKARSLIASHRDYLPEN